MKFYQASSSEMFGKVQAVPQNEDTPFWPRSPYGAAKVYAYWMTVNYREAYGMFACNGILFNHESPRRGETFVTRKSRAVWRGSRPVWTTKLRWAISMCRDWGYAKGYKDVEAMWRMLQQEKPEDFVIATGETHSVREFLEEAFSHVGMDWEKYVQLDNYERPAEVDLLIGDPAKAREKLGWSPKVTFKDLVRLMVDADIRKLDDELSGSRARSKNNHVD